MRAGQSGGFTLIELMIAVVIVAILAAVGYPSYTQYITRASREAAKSELLQIANLQEKIYLNSSAYAFSITGAYNGRSDGGLGVTAGQTSDGKYTLTISPTAGPTQSYTITATPVAGKSQAADGNITIDSTGTRSGTVCCAKW
jgi:type IV pilus assembly protein PilE